MKEERTDNQLEGWEKELKDSGIVNNSEGLSPEELEQERKEIEKAEELLKKAREQVRPKIKGKWKKTGILLSYLLFNLLEFVAVSTFFFIFLPWTFNLPYSFNLYINTICGTLILFGYKRWWKD